MIERFLTILYVVFETILTVIYSIIITIILLFLGFCQSKETPELQAKNKTKNEEIAFKKYMKILKDEGNLIINEKEYFISEQIVYVRHLINSHYNYYYVFNKYSPPIYKSKYFIRGDLKFNEGEEVDTGYHSYVVKRKICIGVTYSTDYDKYKKCKYENKKRGIPFFSEYANIILTFVGEYGFRPYILNELIYDKSKGNDFEKIEQIFDKYNVKKQDEIKTNKNTAWECGVLSENKIDWKDSSKQLNNLISTENNFFAVIDEQCAYEKTIYEIKSWENYGKKFKEYFSKPRKFEEIDWYEFMKFNNIHPIISFELGEMPKSKIEELIKEIKQYYNEEDFTIAFSYNEKVGKNLVEKYIW